MSLSEQKQGGEAFSFVSGLILGFVISAPIAAWLAPRSGSETRGEIRQQGIIIRRKAQRVVRQPIEQLQEKASQLKGDSIEDALEEGKSIASRTLGKVTSELAP